MDFVFQGFQSGLSVWGYILLFLGTTALSWWSYKNIRAIPPLHRYGLILLRSLVFFVLLALLLNPFYKAETTYYEKPEMLVILDNSASTAVEKGNYQGVESYQKLLDELNLKNSDRVTFKFYSLDRDVRPASPESLSFDGSETNLFNAFEVIKSNRQNAAAALLITDGIFNQGRDPVFEAANVNIRVYTIAVGDTTRQRDLIVKNVVGTTTGYVNTRHPLEVTVLNHGFANRSFEVQVRRNNQVIHSQTVTPGADLSSHTLNFELELKEEGLQQFNVVIPAHNDEWTGANNSQPFSVDVLNEKQQILSLALEIHPDVGMIRTLLLSDENTRLISRTWLGGNRFLEGPLEADSDSLDLVILQGYPGEGVPGALNEKISDLLSNVPALILSTPRSSPSALDRQTNVALPILQTGSADYVSVNLSPAVEPAAHPVMELPTAGFQQMPPVAAPVQNVQLGRGAEMLFESNFQGANSGRPLIATRQTGNLRYAQITGYGWYRLALSTNAGDREFVKQLFFNLVSWTATKPDSRRLDINPAQTVFTSGQPVILNAFLTNESGQSESEATIEIAISGDEIQKRYYSMNSTGNGRYQLRLNSLPEGIYTFEASASKGNRLIDSLKGEFSVSGSNIEYVNTQRNDPLLKQIAERSGGMFYVYDRIGSFWNDLDNRGLLTKEEKVRDTLFYPHRHLFWFIIVIILLGTEWGIRKYWALP